MANAGVFPPDVTSNVGLLRILINDTAGVPLSPPVSGQADYPLWSDNSLLGALIVAGDVVYRAAGDLYSALAAEYAQDEESIKTDDLAVDRKGKAATFLKIAQSFYARADSDAATTDSDYFDLAPMGTSAYSQAVEAGVWPELWCEQPWAPLEPYEPVTPPPPAPSGYGY